MTRLKNTTDSAEPRFLPLTEVAQMLSVSSAQAYALVRSGDLQAIKVGGRGQWRVERSKLEEYIDRMYTETQAQVASGRLDSDEVNPDLAATVDVR